ncbi:2-hydroxyacid dehydrogenase [Phreatobacter stygius]|uniref:Glyoxylate/hydroxypyruvate reductase A n=1 Tax=Phreatobacter stygius TaxID=1940610 RepID=A0A4D7B6V3_9HYPH|nr:glyoxylate/hydroxypyruvate reductase A [Phreatobacter stygius]QCI66775.1 glyoxylate/hydroxypyruvate reductase A [Phreatobacter stygius]
MTSIALISERGVLSFLSAQLETALPGATFRHWPETGAAEAEIAICWAPPKGALASMPNLRLIHSIGAGVDNILSDPNLPDLPVCRVVDPKLAAAMAEFILWGTLYFHRRFDEVTANAQAGRWQRLEQTAAGDKRVGILGLGAMGEQAARLLRRVGYRVSGWSRSPRQLEGITVHAGEAALDRFLGKTDILVCLLPLTPATARILDAERLGRLPRGAGLILVSRGEHLVVDDLVGLIRSGHLRGAILDVFDEEPLPPDHPLWREPGVLVTPHMAGLAKPRAIAEQIAENIRRLQAGEPLVNRVDPARGY